MAARRVALCLKCASRQSAQEGFEIVPARRCFICRGLTEKTAAIGERVVRQVSRYESRTFSIGIVIPPEVQEREDQVRSDHQMRGGETIKSQLSKEISEFVSRRTRLKVDKGNPELTILIDLETNGLTSRAKSLFLYGRYSKPKGVSQRRDICEKCGGRGCPECDAGYTRMPSVEKVVGARFIAIFRSSDIKFTWLGSEDPDSVVYPPGRPFVAEVRDPKSRHSPRTFRLTTGRGYVKVSGIRILSGRPTLIPSFAFRTRAFIQSETAPVDLKEAKSINGALVEYRNNKGKRVFRRVHSVRLDRRGDMLIADMKIDGGLPVKRLVSGESTSPSLSEVLKTPLKCQRFDILRVWESGSFEFGKI